METSEQKNVPEPLLNALLYGGPLVYFLVTAVVGLTILEGTVATIALAMAVFGSVFAYVVLKRAFEAQHDVAL